MTISTALTLYCTIGGIVGALIRWGFPYVFSRKEKREQFEKINPYVAAILGGFIGYGVSIFFEADLIHNETVFISYIKKLGLLTAIFTLSVVDKLDKFSSSVSDKVFNQKT